jgi:Xaa-Pro aminopeptidase
MAGLMDDLRPPPFPGFTTEEFERRIDGARRLMAALGIDGMLVTAEANFRYLTGYILQSPVQQARPRYFVLPLAGDPCAIVPRTNVVGMRRTTWVSDIRSWVAPRPEDDGLSLVADALRACTGRFGAIGAELGAESRLGMPVADFLRLREMVAPLRFVDGECVFRRLRMVKSAAEIDRLRRIATIVSDGFEALPQSLCVGDTEWSACRKLQLDLVRRGAHRTPHIVGVSGREGYDNINTGPTDRVLGPGDILFIDTGSAYDNYSCDFDRHFAFGPPSEAVERAYEALYRATEAGLAAVRPGRRACDVWRTMVQALDADGSPGDSVGRMGHGIGLLTPEPPSINQSDETVLEVDMTLTIEPSMFFAPTDPDETVPKIMVHEENIVVTEDGCELISRRAPPEIPVVE